MIKKRKPIARPWLRIMIPAVLITLWFVVAGIGGPYFGRISEKSSVDLTAFLPKSSESARAFELSKKFNDKKTIPAIVIFTAQQGDMDAAKTQAINDRVPELEKLHGVVGEVSPAIVSEDKKAALVVIPTDTELKVADVLGSIKKALAERAITGVDYKVTGPAGFAADLSKAFGGIDGVLLVTALAVVFAILVIVYRSVLLPIIVLMTSMFALTASILVVYILANNNLVTINGQVQGILFILVIGAATDYSLLYVSRYREALYEASSRWDATHIALRGAFEPIIASGSTVIVGLMCLLLSDLASNKALGPVGSVGIAMAMLSALTFLPVLLYALGRTSFWPARPLADAVSHKAHQAKLRSGLWYRVGEFVTRHQRAVWITSMLVLLVAAFGMQHLRADGIEQSKLIIGTSEARDGQGLLDAHFPSGSGSPVVIAASALGHERLVAEIDKDPEIDSVVVVADNSASGTKPLGKQALKVEQKIREAIQSEYDAQLATFAEQRAQLESQVGPVAAEEIMNRVTSNIPSVDQLVAQANPFKDAVAKQVGGMVLLQATLKNAPDAQVSKDAIVRLRDITHRTDSAALVGGTTAVQYDTNQASIHDRKVIIPVVLTAITLILMMLLRSIIAPILLLLTTVLSFASALGVAAWLFNDVMKFPGADPSVVLYAFVFLVALGIDYNIFLMTRVREESQKHGTQKGVIRGLVVTGGVITSAGIVLAATFAALVVIPILFLFQLAFIVAFGVLLDTIVVRSLLVPALVRDLGSFVWWPSKLRYKR